ncbi:MAG: hypothetical protein ACRDN9_12735 [Streptosporangiaceae bacterium]
MRDRVLEPRFQIPDILRRAASRGEINPDAITPQACRAGPAMILAHSLMLGSPPIMLSPTFVTVSTRCSPPWRTPRVGLRLG